MPNWTENYNLRKPFQEEFYDIDEHNFNMDIIDAELHKRATLGDDGKVLSNQLPDLNYIPTSEKGAASGVASLGTDGKVYSSQLPNLNYIPTSEKGKASGVATLGTDGKVPSSQLPEISFPDMNFIPTSEKGAAGGVSTLGSDGKVPSSQLPQIGGKRTVRVSIGSNQYGWTASDCDFLCDGTADEVEINTAIQTLRSTGGEVVLLDGVYQLSSQILMNKEGITLTGNGANTKIIRAFNDDEYSPDQGLILINKSYCTVRNLHIDCMNGTYTANSAINLAEGDNCIIADNTIVNCTGDGIYAVGDYHTIENNVILNCFQGLYLSDCTKAAVTNNRIEEAQSAGVYLYNVEDIVFNNNVVENCADSGIKFQNCNESTFVGNVCNYNAQCGMYITRGDNNVICGNTCNGNGNFAIYVGTTPKNNILTANTYFDNSAGTINLGSTKNVTYSESDHTHSGSDITSGLDTLAASLSSHLSSAKVETGSYSGADQVTGGSGKTLTFSFEPKLVILSGGDANTGTSGVTNSPLVLVNGITRILGVAYYQRAYTPVETNLTWNGNSVSINTSGYNMVNLTYRSYSYVAIG